MEDKLQRVNIQLPDYDDFCEQAAEEIQFRLYRRYPANLASAFPLFRGAFKAGVANVWMYYYTNKMFHPEAFYDYGKTEIQNACQQYKRNNWSIISEVLDSGIAVDQNTIVEYAEQEFKNGMDWAERKLSDTILDQKCHGNLSKLITQAQSMSDNYNSDTWAMLKKRIEEAEYFLNNMKLATEGKK